MREEEILLAAAEAAAYKKQMEKEVWEKYNSKTGYRSVYVELVRPGHVILFFEGSRKYKQPGGKECESNWYGAITAKTSEEAEKKLYNMTKEFKQSNYTKIKTWGPVSPNSSVEETTKITNGFEQKFKKITRDGKTWQLGVFTNNNKDVAVEIEVLVYPDNMEMPKLEEGNTTSAKKTTITLQPGESTTMNLGKDGNAALKLYYKVPAPKDDRFDITDKPKQLLREYFIKNGKSEPKRAISLGSRH